MVEGRRLVERVVAPGDRVYGVTTGVAVRKRVRVPPEQLEEFSRRLIENHRVGTGPSRRTTSSARSTTDGSLPSACSAPSARRISLRSPTSRTGLLDGYRLQAREGLALLNNNASSTALSALAIHGGARLLDALDVAGALDLEAFAANLTILHPRVGETRPYPAYVEP